MTVLRSPLRTALRSSVYSPLVGKWGGGGRSLKPFRLVIEADARDVHLQVIGDSTGNGTSEWVYRIGGELAALYPTHSVVYYLYDNTTHAYGTPIVIATGSGDHTIHIWNASIAGAGFNTLRGSADWDDAIDHFDFRGPELISNGTFDTDAAGWTLGTAASWLSQQINLAGSAGTGGATQSYAQQAIPTEAGNVLNLKADAFTRAISVCAGTDSTGPTNGVGGTNILANTVVAAATSLDTEITPTSGTTYLTINRTALNAAQFDNVSLKEVLTHPDAIVVNLGHNATGMNSTPSVQRGEIIALIEDLLLTHPGTPLAMVQQNPWRDEDTMDAVAASIRYVQELRPEVTLIDVRSRFIAQGKASALYVDNVHPSTDDPASDGTSLFVAAFMAAFSRAGALPREDDFLPWTSDWAADDLHVNGGFTAFDSSVPDGWTLQGTGAVLSKETTIKAAGKAHSVKLINGSAASHLRQQLDAGQLAAVAGRTVTLAIHYYIDPSGSPDIATGRHRIFTQIDGVTDLSVLHQAGNIAQGRFRWDFISGQSIPEATTLFWSMVYANSAGGDTLGTIYIDEFRLFIGEKPGA